MIGICTDSNSQLPDELAARFGIEVVPLTMVVDHREYLEGFDFDVDDFYSLFAGGHRPCVEFIQPSPGQFALAYEELVARGCTQILSIHSSPRVSDTLKAARLAAHSAPVPVRLIDSHTSRFGVSCCVWATAEAIAGGATLDEATAVAESLQPLLGNVFVLAGLDLVGHDVGHDVGREAGRGDPQGRRFDESSVLHGCARQRKVMTLVDGQFQTVREVGNLVDAVNAMAGYIRCRSEHVGGRGLNVAIGSAHQAMRAVAEALATAVGSCPHVNEVVQFRVGPSVGIETGPGTVGCVMYPA